MHEILTNTFIQTKPFNAIPVHSNLRAWTSPPITKVENNIYYNGNQTKLKILNVDVELWQPDVV